jgi:hypothetical protein
MMMTNTMTKLASSLLFFWSKEVDTDNTLWLRALILYKKSK